MDNVQKKLSGNVSWLSGLLSFVGRKKKEDHSSEEDDLSIRKREVYYRIEKATEQLRLLEMEIRKTYSSCDEKMENNGSRKVSGLRCAADATKQVEALRPMASVSEELCTVKPKFHLLQKSQSVYDSSSAPMPVRFKLQVGKTERQGLHKNQESFQEVQCTEPESLKHVEALRPMASVSEELCTGKPAFHLLQKSQSVYDSSSAPMPVGFKLRVGKIETQGLHKNQESFQEVQCTEPESLKHVEALRPMASVSEELCTVKPKFHLLQKSQSVYDFSSAPMPLGFKLQVGKTERQGFHKDPEEAQEVESTEAQEVESTEAQEVESTELKTPQHQTGFDLSEEIETAIVPPETVIVNQNMLNVIWTWLPVKYSVEDPKLVYSSEIHGGTLETLYSMADKYEPTLIVIKTTTEEVFGAFCSTSWEKRKLKQDYMYKLSFFGTGQSFVFTLKPDLHKYEWVGLHQKDPPDSAHSFQAGNDGALIVGGGGSGEAIQLDANLLYGKTSKCATFNNEPLCSSENFLCKVVEVYRFQSDHSVCLHCNPFKSVYVAIPTSQFPL